MYYFYVAQYCGIGPLSTAIRLFTRSQWSHSAIVFPPIFNYEKYILVEAWGTKGVVQEVGHTLIDVLKVNHRSKTPIDIFTLTVTKDEFFKAREFAMSIVGADYDWSLINKFVTRKPASMNNKWICSEATQEICIRAGHPLQRMPSWKMAPEHCGISTVIEPHSRIILP